MWSYETKQACKISFSLHLRLHWIYNLKPIWAQRLWNPAVLCHLIEVPVAITGAKLLSTCCRSWYFPSGSSLCWFTLSPSKHSTADAKLFDVLRFCTSTLNHTSDEGVKSNVCTTQSRSVKRSSRPISGSSVAAVMPSLIHGRCLGCRLELATEVTESDPPDWEFWKNCVWLHSCRCQVVSGGVGPSLQSQWPQILGSKLLQIIHVKGFQIYSLMHHTCPQEKGLLFGKALLL